jgi:hypothetical protein
MGLFCEDAGTLERYRCPLGYRNPWNKLMKKLLVLKQIVGGKR